MPATRTGRPTGLLIAAEGLDGSGKSAGLDSLGRWLERKGRRVHLVRWEPSRLVAKAAVAPRGRQILTPRIAALLAASEAADRLAVEFRRPLARGDVVLADRYAWTAIAREVARGLEPEWVAALYRFMPRPDLVVFHRQEPAVALARALATRPTPVGAEAIAAAYTTFLDRLLATYERLLADPAAGPWPVPALTLDPRSAPAVRVDAIRERVRPLLAGTQSAGGGRVSGATATRPGPPAPRVPGARPGAHGEAGVLFVLEGIDRSGRSTHVRRLEEHLRYMGRGVTRTSLASSLLSGDRIRAAKRGRHADPVETALLYAADLAERVEQVVVPSLRAGLVVIADRYCWTPMARAEARGVDGDWLQALFAFVPAPDAVLFLDVDAEASLARSADAPDPYEAGLDLGLSVDVRESYRLFGERLYGCFDRYAGPAGFTRIPAAAPVEAVGQRVLRAADAILVGRGASAPGRAGTSAAMTGSPP